MKIQKDTVATVHYVVRDADGELIDSSREEGCEPLSYLHGYDNIVSGLESALEGQEAGAKLAVTVEPKDAYGDWDEELDLSVPLEAFPEEARPELVPDMLFIAEHPKHGEEVPVQYRVIEVDGDQVIISGNHPLAGETLSFDVEVLEVRAATPEEVAHGHSHDGTQHEDENDDVQG